MNFITNLLLYNWQDQVFNSILVFVDRYTKIAMYIPSRMDWKAETIADVVAKTLLWKYSSPETFISDRGSLFTAYYWKAFCTHLTIHCWYSITFHLQTDGQTEQQNQTLKQYLRSYINYQQDDWVNWLSMAEFAYNNNKHSSTRVISFFTAYSWDLRWEKNFGQQMK